MLGSALAVWVAAANVAGAAAAEGPMHYERTNWIALHVARDQRTLFVSYVSGGCARGPRAKVQETADYVRITVSQLQPEPTVICHADLRLPQLKVKLDRPLDGRRLRGQAKRFPGPRSWRTVWRGDRVVSVAPRLIGLAAPDALRGLRHQGFRARLGVGTRCGTVSAQQPPPGTEVPDRRLTLSAAGHRSGCNA
jgi:hypothetical protein